MPKNDIDVGTGLVGAPAYVIFTLYRENILICAKMWRCYETADSCR